jgi:hypothetical protein
MDVVNMSGPGIEKHPIFNKEFPMSKGGVDVAIDLL